MSSVVNGYVRLFGLPKKNYWSSHNGNFILSIFKTVLICFRIFFDSHKIYHLHIAKRGSILRKFLISIFIRLKKKIYVVHLHGGESKNLILKSKFERKFTESLLHNSNAIICITKDMENFLAENMQIKNNIFVIPNFCETISKNPVDFMCHKEPVKIVYCGTFVKSKGIFDLIEAFDRAKFENPATLDLFGNGTPLKVEKRNINVCGWFEHNEYLKLLPSYDFLVLPSYIEVFPMSILEAMGVGLPVISTYTGGIPEMIENGKNGILFKAGNIDELTNVLEKLANDKNLRINLGRNAWNDVKERFSPEIVLGKLEGMYGKT
jgi:glycosyltransferase involved in cell wall biosynthesis